MQGYKHSVFNPLHIQYAQADMDFWRITHASRSWSMVTYTMHQLITLYIWGWPIDTKGLADVIP